MRGNNKYSEDNKTEQRQLPAGDFSFWLAHTRDILVTERGTDVDCGECVACCSSFQFVHIRPEETDTLGCIPKDLLVAAPGQPKGYMLLGYDKKGHCPMLANGKCSIYDHRPLTCRNYDCRVFTAAGITPGDGIQIRITQQAMRWQFSYPARRDLDEHTAVRAAARFIQDHAECFPNGRIPIIPSQLAILAIKVYDVFLRDDEKAETGRALSDVDVANAIVAACKKFDSQISAPTLIRNR